MRFAVRTLGVILASTTILAGCANKTAPPAQPSITVNGQVYHSVEAARAAGKTVTDAQIAATTPIADRVGGRALIVTADADRIRPMALGTVPQSTSPALLDLLIEFNQQNQRAVAEAVKRSNIFDSVETVERNDTDNPADAGYDYVLWFKIATTGPNHTGKWTGRWELRRGTDPAEENPTFDAGVPERERMVSFVRSVREMAAKLGGPSLASATGAGNGATAGTLTGIVVGAHGDIVTNDHGIKSCGSVHVRTQTLNLPATIVARDRQNDLALLHIDHSFTIPATFREGAIIRQGENVVAIGYPYGAQFASNPTVTNGSISGLTGVRDDTRFLQFTAPVQPGNSGGPLLDPSGHVVGLVSSKLNGLLFGKVTGDLPQNVNFALKSSVVREFLDANGVKYRAAPSTTELKSADIAEQAKQSAVYVECGK